MVYPACSQHGPTSSSEVSCLKATLSFTNSLGNFKRKATFTIKKVAMEDCGPFQEIKCIPASVPQAFRVLFPSVQVYFILNRHGFVKFEFELLMPCCITFFGARSLVFFSDRRHRGTVN